MGYLAAKIGQKQPSQTDREELIISLVNKLNDLVKPVAIYLFGSALGDKFTYASDIDL